LLLRVLRALASSVLGTIISTGFLLLLLVNTFSGKLLSADFYSRTLNQQDTYNRIYNEVLLDEEVKRSTQQLLGDIKWVDQEDIVGLLREIIPPDYIKTQVEGAIEDAIDYLNKDVDTLEIYIDLGPPLVKVKPVLFEYIDQRIDGLEVVDLGGRNCNPEQLLNIKARFEDFFRALAAGNTLPAVPSLEPIPLVCRAGLFLVLFTEANLAVLFSDYSGREGVIQGLMANSGEIRRSFVDRGDTRGVLKAVARPLLTPLVDDAISELRRGLDSQDRLAVIPLFANREAASEKKLRATIDDVRNRLNYGLDLGRKVAPIMVIGGAILMGLVHLPRLSNALRRPGLTLILTGGGCYVTAKIAQSTLPSRLADLLAGGATPVLPIPQSAIDPGRDILQSLSQQIFAGLAGPSLVLLVVGAVLFAGSFAIARFGPRSPASVRLPDG